MSKRKVHLMYDETNQSDALFAQGLIDGLEKAELEQAAQDDSPYIAGIGGDGHAINIIRLNPGKKIVNLTHHASSSVGFRTNRHILNATDLAAAFQSNAFYIVKPLKAEIKFADGSCTVRYGVNDIVLRGTHQPLPEHIRKKYKIPQGDVSEQSILVDMRLHFNDAGYAVSEQLIGSGIIVATPYGSTAMNRKYGGHVLALEKDEMAVTGIGLEDFSPRVHRSGTTIELTVPQRSLQKRVVKVSYDGYSVIGNENGSPISSVRISLADDHAVQLILKDDRGSKEYAEALAP